MKEKERVSYCKKSESVSGCKVELMEQHTRIIFARFKEIAMSADEDERRLAVGSARGPDELEPVVELGLGELLGEVEGDDVDGLRGERELVEGLVDAKVPQFHGGLLEGPRGGHEAVLGRRHALLLAQDLGDESRLAAAPLSQHHHHHLRVGQRAREPMQRILVTEALRLHVHDPDATQVLDHLAGVQLWVEAQARQPQLGEPGEAPQLLRQDLDVGGPQVERTQPLQVPDGWMEVQERIAAEIEAQQVGEEHEHRQRHVRQLRLLEREALHVSKVRPRLLDLRYLLWPVHERPRLQFQLNVQLME